MFEAASMSEASTRYALCPRLSACTQSEALPDSFAEPNTNVLHGLLQRLQRERCRRKVGRAYDMALEIARIIPNAYEILDVGCGNGFIAHHLAGLLGSYVLGIDVDGPPQAAINFRHYDGRNLPTPDHSFEAVLFCYVLHHAQDVGAIFSELRCVLRAD
jgi:SAM-dependent methyltransferase